MTEEIDRYKLQPALAHAAEAACSYYLTDGFCGPRNCQQCKCWDQARAVMDATGLSARAVGFIFKHRHQIEEAAEQEETRIYQGVPWWSKPERIAAESKLASTERPDRHPSPTRAEMVEARNKALEEAALSLLGMWSKSEVDFILCGDTLDAAIDRIRALTKADSESASGEKAK